MYDRRVIEDMKVLLQPPAKEKEVKYFRYVTIAVLALLILLRLRGV